MLKVGDKVMMISKEKHDMNPECYPPLGTMGVIIDIDEVDNKYPYNIQWEKGTTSGHDCWWASEDTVALFTDAISEYTDEEVWAFLAPKMSQFTNVNFVDNEVMKMVVTAYRSGYGRAIKGRPFKIKPKRKIADGSVVGDINKLLDGMNLWGVYGLDNLDHLVVREYKFKHARFNKNTMSLYDSLEVEYEYLKLNKVKTSGWDVLMHDVLYVESNFRWALEGDLVTNPECEKKFIGEIVEVRDNEYTILSLNDNRIYPHVPIFGGTWKRLVSITTFLKSAGVDLTPYKKRN